MIMFNASRALCQSVAPECVNRTGFTRFMVWSKTVLDSDLLSLQIVRYLYEDGAEVGANQPYVECEAMKMIMQLRTTEAGKIKNSMQPGSIIGAGDLIATMQLKDPSKVKKILPYTGAMGEVIAEDLSSLDEVNFVLDGFPVCTSSHLHACFI
jgi:hypothetical protein